MWIGRASLSVIFVETIRIDGEYYVSKVKFHHFASFYEVSIIVSLMEFLDFICIGGEGIISSLVEFLCVFDLSLSFFLSSSIYSNVKFSLADLWCLLHRFPIHNWWKYVYYLRRCIIRRQNMKWIVCCVGLLILSPMNFYHKNRSEVSHNILFFKSWKKHLRILMHMR